MLRMAVLCSCATAAAAAAAAAAAVPPRTLLWSGDALLRTRAAVAREESGLRDVVAALRREAGAAALLAPLSVTSNVGCADRRGDPHDYNTHSSYAWPCSATCNRSLFANCSKWHDHTGAGCNMTTGFPWVGQDGYNDPACACDRPKWSSMVGAVNALAASACFPGLQNLWTRASEPRTPTKPERGVCFSCQTLVLFCLQTHPISTETLELRLSRGSQRRCPHLFHAPQKAADFGNLKGIGLCRFQLGGAIYTVPHEPLCGEQSHPYCRLLSCCAWTFWSAGSFSTTVPTPSARPSCCEPGSSTKKPTCGRGRRTRRAFRASRPPRHRARLGPAPSSVPACVSFRA